ncbi:hypothetical protein KsCSTR_46400 [Candidatus Kuenenia stuttgartiensis]|uniref:Uncharacterized protein n=1 Tax=Kuenenia stuttgartiensis TaxID=174633 RepID=A0A6G7GWP6_KUEST|nr:hypothetical protein KsCSTR_46400 [Candidatus Kuenenia stuttgartiensis]
MVIKVKPTVYTIDILLLILNLCRDILLLISKEPLDLPGL